MSSQRLQFKEWLQGKPTPLTKQRKELLDEIGFVWQVRARPDWSSKFEELVEYKNQYGDTVSSWYDVQLEIVDANESSPS